MKVMLWIMIALIAVIYLYSGWLISGAACSMGNGLDLVKRILLTLVWPILLIRG